MSTPHNEEQGIIDAAEATVYDDFDDGPVYDGPDDYDDYDDYED